MFINRKWLSKNSAKGETEAEEEVEGEPEAAGKAEEEMKGQYLACHFKYQA